jgi:hypothetical protein
MTTVLGTRPGTDIDFEGRQSLNPATNEADTVAIIITHDSGPANEVVECESFEAFTEVFGDSATGGRTAVASAFDGQGLPGGGGAGAVLVYRQVASEGAVAKVTVQNTTPAAALKLSAKFKGTRGNSLSYGVAADVGEAEDNIFTVLFKGVVVETYVYAKTNIKLLAETLNAQSAYLTAEEEITGVALKTTAGTSLTGGNNGETLTGTNYLAACEALKFEQFTRFAFQDLVTAEIQATVFSWLEEMIEKNRPVTLVVGGDAGDTMDEAITRSTDLASPHVINLGVGTYLDDLVGETLSTAQLAPRVCGALAGLGLKNSGTFARFGSLHIVTGPQDDEVEDAIENGVTVFSEAIAEDADTKIELCQTTYTTKNNPLVPFEIFSDPRLVAIMDQYIRNMKEWGDANSIGGVINVDTIAAVKQKGIEEQTELEKGKLIQAGSGTFEVTSPKPEEIPAGGLKQAIIYSFGWNFLPTNLHLIGNGTVG